MNRKRFGLLLPVVLLLLVFVSAQGSSAEPAQQKKIMLASTRGPIDAGIVGALEEAFTKKTGIIIEHKGAGTGQALK